MHWLELNTGVHRDYRGNEEQVATGFLLRGKSRH
jgi:hypothetical protein